MPPGKRGKDWRLCRPPHGITHARQVKRHYSGPVRVYPPTIVTWPIVVQSPPARVAHSGPGPIGWHSRPLFMAPRPGACIQRRGRMIQVYRGPGVHGAGRLYPAGPWNPGRYAMMSMCGGIVPGAAPMGAGLVPSTGATGAVMMWGPFPCPERGACRLMTVVLYHRTVILSTPKYAEWVKK